MQLYLARDNLNRTLVLKTVDEDRVNHRLLNFFARETLTTARSRHTSIVPVYQAGKCDNRPWYLMPHYERGSLADNLAYFRARPGLILPNFIPILEALESLHAERLVHRDFKPHNILVGNDDRFYLADLGLVMPLGGIDEDSMGPPPADSPLFSGMGLESLTEECGLFGTPSYMAPEQYQLDSIDVRADIWAVGVVLYELIVGLRPFPLASLAETKRSVLAGDYPAIDANCSPLAPLLAPVIARCLQLDPDMRYQSIRELLEDLRPSALPHSETLLDMPSAKTVVIPRLVRPKKKRFAPKIARPLLAVAAVALLAFVAGRSGSASAPRNDDPEVASDPMAAELNEIRNGRPALLIGQPMPPKWYRPLIPDSGDLYHSNPLHTFRVHSLSPSATILIEDPLSDHFRLEAECRYMSSALGSTEGGIFVGGEVVQIDGISTYSMIGWVFRYVRAPLEDEQDQTGPITCLDHIVWSSTCLSPDKRGGCPSWSMYTPPRDVPPKTALNEIWQSMAIEVRGRKLSFFADGKLSQTVLPQRLESGRVSLNKLVSKFSTPLRAEWSLRAPVGLYACNGAIAFRNVRLIPLDKE